MSQTDKNYTTLYFYLAAILYFSWGAIGQLANPDGFERLTERAIVSLIIILLAHIFSKISFKAFQITKAIGIILILSHFTSLVIRADSLAFHMGLIVLSAGFFILISNTRCLILYSVTTLSSVLTVSYFIPDEKSAHVVGAIATLNILIWILQKQREKVFEKWNKTEHQFRKEIEEINLRDSLIIKEHKERLEEKSKEIESLIARVSHELRTPITAANMLVDELLDNLEEQEEPDKDQEEILKRVENNLRDLEQQTRNLLDRFIDKAEKEVYFDIKQTTEYLLSNFEIMNPDVNIYRELESVEYKGVKSEVETIFCNLISNAVKFTQPMKDKKVECYLSAQEDFFELLIKDSGIGMEEGFYSTESEIFKVGQRAEISKRFETRGYGIGLNTTKQFVDKLGGTLLYYSAGDKMGTIVYLKIPIYNNIVEEVI